MEINMTYITKNNNSIMVRVPRTKQVNFNKHAIHAALDERDRLCKELGISNTDREKIRIRKKLNKNKINLDLPSGISRVTNRNRSKSEKYYKTISVSYEEDGKRKTHQFPYPQNDSKLEKEAIKKAISFKNKKLEEKFKCSMWNN